MFNPASPTTQARREHRRRFERFGGHVELRVEPAAGQHIQAEQRLDRATDLLREFDDRLSRFDPGSELCQLNADARECVPGSPMMHRFIEAVRWAGRKSDGLVDATCLPDVERAGYTSHLAPDTLDGGLDRLLARELDRSDNPDLVDQAHTFATGRLAPPTEEPTAPRPPRGQDWRDVFAGQDLIYRPFGVRLDSGGIGKGLAADLVADVLRGAPAWMVDCGGDLRIGGTDRRPRAINVRDPLDRHRIVHQLHVTSGAVATSGVTRRSWDDDGVRSHHLIDPRTGLPAATGVLQVTALAPTGVEAETLAKMALLAGPDRAHSVLEHGGVVICENGTIELVPPPVMRRSPLEQRQRPKFVLPTGTRQSRADQA